MKKILSLLIVILLLAPALAGAETVVTSFYPVWILTLNLTNGSTFTGSIDGAITNASGETVSTEVGKVAVKLDSTSTWTLTADTYITSFDGDASNIVSNGYTLYVNGTALTGTK